MSGKKKLVYVVLLLLALILQGCAPGQSDVAGSTHSLESTESTPVTEETEGDIPPWINPVLETVPDYNGTILIEPDPDRKFYCSLANQDCDFYEDTTFSTIPIFIITKEPYALSDIHVTVPMQTAHKIDIEEFTDFCREIDTSFYAQCFSLRHYLMLQGLDFEALGQERRYSDYASSKASEAMSTRGLEGLEDFEKWSAISDVYRNKITRYQEKCGALTADDLPEFYCYLASIWFSDAQQNVNFVEETVTQLELTLGEEKYTIEFGEWRIHDTLPKEIQRDNYGLFQHQVALVSTDSNAYGQGYEVMPDAFSFTAKKDLTVTGVRIFGSDIELLGEGVYMNASPYAYSYGISDPDFYWDGSTTFDVSADQTVNISVFLYDECFAQYEVCRTLVLIMDYEVDGVPHYMTLPCYLNRDNNTWDTYLMAFEGLDMGKYYTCFHRLQPYWSNIPENWRR